MGYIIPKALLKLQAQHPDKIQEVEYNEYSDGYWLHLHYGWYGHSDPGRHSIHEDTVKATIAEFKNVKPCTCSECSSR